MGVVLVRNLFGTWSVSRRHSPQPTIVSTLRRQLSWSHFKQLIYLEADVVRRRPFAVGG